MRRGSPGPRAASVWPTRTRVRAIEENFMAGYLKLLGGTPHSVRISDFLILASGAYTPASSQGQGVLPDGTRRRLCLHLHAGASFVAVQSRGAASHGLLGHAWPT